MNGCPCACNHGGFCGGCGHTGCGGTVHARPHVQHTDFSDVRAASASRYPFGALGACRTLELCDPEAWCPVHETLHPLLTRTTMATLAAPDRGTLHDEETVNEHGFVVYQVRFPSMRYAYSFISTVSVDTHRIDLAEPAASLWRPAVLSIHTFLPASLQEPRWPEARPKPQSE